MVKGAPITPYRAASYLDALPLQSKLRSTGLGCQLLSEGTNVRSFSSEDGCRDRQDLFSSLKSSSAISPGLAVAVSSTTSTGGDDDVYLIPSISEVATSLHSSPCHGENSNANELLPYITGASSLLSQAEKSSSESDKCEWGIMALGFANVLIDSALGSAIVPILPKILGLDELHEGIVLSIGSVTGGLAGPLCGWLSDTWGWQWALVWFYPAVLGSALLMMLGSRSFSTFVIARLVAGIGTGLMYPSTYSMIVATHSIECRSTALGVVLAGDVGSLGGPLLGGYLYDMGGTALVFSLLCGLAIVAFVLFLTVAVGSSVQPPSRNSTTTRAKITKNLMSDENHFTTLKSDSNLRLTTPLNATAKSASKFRINKVYNLLTSTLSDKRRSSLPSSLQSVKCSPALPSSVRNLRPFPYDPEAIYVNLSHLTTDFDVTHPRISAANLTIPPIARQASDEKITHSLLNSARVTFGIFLDQRFLTLCAVVFYLWGVGVTIFAILPTRWNNQFNLPPSTIGLLLLPHVILRVLSLSLMPFVSDCLSVPLPSFILGGVILTAVPMFALGCLGEVTPIWHAACAAIMGIGIGTADSTTFAWAGLMVYNKPVEDGVVRHHRDRCHSISGMEAGAQTPTTVDSGGESDGAYKKRKRRSESGETVCCSDAISEVEKSDESLGEEFRGRGFALLAASCEVGVLVVPCLASYITEYLSFRIAFKTFGALGILIVLMLPYAHLL